VSNPRGQPNPSGSYLGDYKLYLNGMLSALRGNPRDIDQSLVTEYESELRELRNYLEVLDSNGAPIPSELYTIVGTLESIDTAHTAMWASIEVFEDENYNTVTRTKLLATCYRDCRNALIMALKHWK
jgi:hypothetical protein